MLVAVMFMAIVVVGAVVMSSAIVACVLFMGCDW
jgi:hypothetical protein